MAGALIEIGLLLYPGAQLAAVHGLTDLFEVANRLARERNSTCVLRVSHWRLEEPAGSAARVFDTNPDAPGAPAILIAPPSLGELQSREAMAPLALWLKAQHAAGATLGSVCAGAFLIAETGLLAGRAATTHWVYAETLQQRYPQIIVDTDKLIIDDGDIITAGGLMAWTDLGLKLIDRLLGPTIMAETARFLLVDPPGREQRFYSHFAPKLRHGDEAILKVQHWLQAQGARETSLPAMAARAGLEQRTFLRRFSKATGLRPVEYCQHLRVGKAREMLEFTGRSVEEIAFAVGYADPGAFRKVFVKVVGLSPGHYRTRFSAARPANR
ncbi:GlxA family transcriptional regulator [Methylocella silvestris]|uniref:AraC family transcriptional regulator n=1 Tax=Methylocella silvestris TaxID=199596 RepID=A0A2J7TJ12_METSI|nr:GlxA family transcriptional regulator [Methylocella silvestris]PNG26751.1 AraC family transcriptional regulator [Methylocella silvestris]